MSIRSLPVAVMALGITATALAASPLAVTTRMLVERHVAAADGSARTELVAPAKVVPGDRITVVLAYRNTGPQPLANVVLFNPVPRGMAFRAAAPGSAVPELSIDGHEFGSLARLRVTAPNGATRAATANDVTQVRWRLPSPVAAGAGGELAFQAVLK